MVVGIKGFWEWGILFSQSRFCLSDELSLRKTPCDQVCHSRHIYLSPPSIGLRRFRISLLIPTMKHKIPVFRRGFDISLVGNEGFEPPMPESESGALPLGEFPVELVRSGLYEKKRDTQIFFS